MYVYKSVSNSNVIELPKSKNVSYMIAHLK